MLFWTSEANQARILTRVGLAVIAVVAMAVALIAVNPLRRDDHRIALVISTEYVGQGVADGSPVVVHGVRVGEVDAVSSRPEGGAVLRLRLARDTAAELTDTIGLDFRPANYFGITGVNLVPGAGGAPRHLPDLRAAVPPPRLRGLGRAARRPGAPHASQHPAGPLAGGDPARRGDAGHGRPARGRPTAARRSRPTRSCPASCWS